MVQAKPTIIELDMGKLDDLLDRLDSQDLHTEDYATIHSVIESYVGLFQAVGDKNTTIARLRKLLFGEQTATAGSGLYCVLLRLQSVVVDVILAPCPAHHALTFPKGKMARRRKGKGVGCL